MWASKANQAKETDIDVISTDIFGVLTGENHHNALKAEQRRQVESTKTSQNIKAFAIWPHIQKKFKGHPLLFFHVSTYIHLYRETRQ